MTKKTKKFDPDIEDRIIMEIVVDAYDESERAMGWYHYLEDRMHFPFNAECNYCVSTSPLSKGQRVNVIGMDQPDNCEYDMFGKIARFVYP